MSEYNHEKQKSSNNFLRGCLITLAIICILIISAGVIFGFVILKRFPNLFTPFTLKEEFVTEEETVTEQEFMTQKELSTEEKTTEEVVEEPQIIKIETKEANPVAAVAKKVQPSVVNIAVEVIQYDIFGREYISKGIGSGVIFSKDGYILTNDHVVKDARKIEVTFFDGKKNEAELIGTEPRADIAVIKVDRKDLRPAEFISVKDIEVGDLAVAIGSPFGFEQTVTSGVVSALGREILEILEYEGKELVVDLIQTDAAINMGNSGGALANIEGKVMGINTIIVSPTQTYAGLGFAIPSDIATNIANQLIKYGKSRIPVIGISMGDSTDPNVPGVLVYQVIKGLPAEKAGIKVGDIITKCNDIVLKDLWDLKAEIIKHNVGDKLELEIYRDGKIFTTIIELVDTPTGY